MKKLRPQIFFLLILLALMAVKFHLGLIRIFDPDEFSHANWAYMIARGYIPYRDFFYYYTPVFQWILTPFFALPEGAYLVILIRILNWLIYGGVLIFLYKMVKRISGSLFLAFFSCFFFLSFPIIFDKILESRPESFMIFFFIAGLYLLLSNKQYFFSGLFIGLSFLTLQKMIFAVPALLYLLLTIPEKKKLPQWIPFFLGGAIPFLIFLVYLGANNIILLGWDSIIRGSLSTNFGSGSFSLLNTLQPWPVVYVVKGGFSWPWFMQMILWVVGIIGIPFVVWKKRRIGIFLLLFDAAAIAMLIFYKRPFAQYFIPVALSFSVTAAAVVVAMLSFIKKNQWKTVGAILFSIPFIVSFLIQYQVRVSSTNSEQLEVLRLVHEKIPRYEPMVDLVGSFVYRPNGFFYSFAKYAQFIYAFNPKAPTLTESLIRTQTKYIVLDQTAAILNGPPPSDLSFITIHYLPSDKFKIYTPGVKFVCENSSCIQYNLHGAPALPYPTTTFNLHIKGKYRVTTSPAGSTVFVNNKTIHDGEILDTPTQTFRFTTPPQLSTFTIQFVEEKI